MCIMFATLTWPENPADAKVLNSKIFLGACPQTHVLPHANFPHIVQHRICCPTYARATTLFWLRHCLYPNPCVWGRNVGGISPALAKALHVLPNS